VPCNVFVAVTHWHDNDKTRLGVESYLLNRKLARCYDTFGAGRYVAEEPDAILLGIHPSARERPGSEPEAAPVAAPSADIEQLPAGTAIRWSDSSGLPSTLRALTPSENAERPGLLPPRAPTSARDITASDGSSTG
jgi:hypothetical protein